MISMEIRKALVTVAYNGWYKDAIMKALEPAQIVWCDSRDDKAVLEGVQGADVAILNEDLDKRILTGKDLKWIHCNHAGLNESARQEIFDRNIIVTGSAGRSGPVLAEHVLFFALSLIYHGPAQYEAQKAHKWRGAGDYIDDRGLFGKTMGIVGLGYTGKELALRCKALGMTVIGYDRLDMKNPENVDEFYSMDRGDTVEPLLRKSDIVTLCCRLSDETYHLINSTTIDMMKSSALLINMSRGAVVDSPALVEALRSGRIAGAGSDVFEEEPLPADSIMWDAPNFVMTPHCTPEMPDMPARCVDIIKDNINRYRADFPMRNQLILRDLYSHGKNE